MDAKVKVTIFFRGGGIIVSYTTKSNTPLSIGQRFGGGFMICEDQLWNNGKSRTIVINLVDVCGVILEDEPSC